MSTNDIRRNESLITDVDYHGLKALDKKRSYNNMVGMDDKPGTVGSSYRNHNNAIFQTQQHSLERKQNTADRKNNLASFEQRTHSRGKTHLDLHGVNSATKTL